MRVHEALHATGIDPAESEILLAWILACDRSWFLAHAEDALSEDHEELYRKCLAQRSSGMPVSFITGEKEFFGRGFTVDRRALIPRPSTEGLVTMALEWLKEPKDSARTLEQGIIGITRVFHQDLEPKVVADIGTGSGCVAVTLALELPGFRIIATDTSQDALALAQENALRHGVLQRITFHDGHLLDPISQVSDPFVIVANLPYLPEEHPLASEVADFEPPSSLYGGERGFELTAELLRSAGEHPCCIGAVVECLSEHADCFPKTSERPR